MIGALWTGISGLASHQKALDNESHNIANVNTVGYKSSRISFADQMYQDRIGKGSKILDAEKLYVQGNLKVTGVNYDMALSGDGFFVVSDESASGTSETFYTRAGNFRMGDNGTLQDAAGNEVQGWAMTPIADDDVTSTNPNISVFTSDYTQLLSSKTVEHSNYIETFTAKSTDYSKTVKADSEAVFNGDGYKSESSKVDDVKALMTNYSNAVQDYQETPDGTSQSSISQVTQINFEGTAFNKEGDQIYVYVNGDKIAQNYISSSARGSYTAEEASQIDTYKALADKISTTTGLVAYTITDSTTGTQDSFESGDTFTRSTSDADVLRGMIEIKSLIPGEAFTITEVAEVSGNQPTYGTYNQTTSAVTAVEGTGLGALESARNALSIALSGNQRDVYSTQELNLNGTDDYSIEITVYDKDTKSNVTVGPISITNESTMDDVVAAINQGGSTANTAQQALFDTYFTAKSTNGSLVIQTNDKNYDVEFSTEITAATATYSPTSGASVTFTGATAILANGQSDFTYSSTGVSAITITAPDSIGSIVSELNATTSFSAAGLTASQVGGELVIAHATSVDPTVVKVASVIDKNAAYSGRKGAGAEFIEIVNKVDQTASRDSLQLRLDTLDISDSPFGEFSVDSSGLITMKQDGAEFAIGQVAIALFNNQRGLEPNGNNLLAKTTASGEPSYNINNDRTAKIESQTLELSRADLSESLVNLMVFQRAFEANAKSITTSDTLLNTLINLKR